MIISQLVSEFHAFFKDEKQFKLFTLLENLSY
jgi:hypothetical protein